MPEIQVGIIACKCKQKKYFANAKPLYMKHSEELIFESSAIMNNACQMFIDDVFNFAKNGF